ncbi:biotin-dependent carboxyltransferase family protein [Geosporobacter ferrireducens]|uniref:KipI antagonist n=1 Tax=Geosporobacter ferrireducens TaxID=1424294 RepID=A0A1D8GHX7_9FIRM|nr:biotin-dependent carboxyltransferase family protein [Geosporobacter ferrireducens]AOT70506.1 KipI antagonist [Geosporobacter ferrireducens]MTI57140.1 biotin-dependent carboxyltransferase family protein [Geosporobacter ferrireducens]
MGKFKVLHPGLLTSVQDGGRYGYQQFGVPVAGVMDSFAHRIANILVENEENEAVLEITLLGPQIEFLSEAVIAITGGNLSPEINRRSVEMWKSIYVKSGDILSFSGAKTGCRSYIAFAGGIDVPIIMGSKSTYAKAKIGGYEGRLLKAEDILDIGNTKYVLSSSKRSLPRQYIPEYKNHFEVQVVLGPQDDLFTTKGIETFLSNPYTVTNECDRMGFRLEGEEIEHIQGGDIISDGIALGAIQVPGHGKPIIMMADRQTTGGYTKIGNVIWEDLNKIAQAKPGDIIRFKKITVEDAHQRLRAFENKISEIRKNCKDQKVIHTREFQIRINGKSYEVMVEEIK